MMSTIVNQKLISFKELEQKVFKYVCELEWEITRIILESYDNVVQQIKSAPTIIIVDLIEISTLSETLRQHPAYKQFR